jgi:hypothetical protein
VHGALLLLGLIEPHHQIFCDGPTCDDASMPGG